MQFTSDEVAQIVGSAVNAVLEALKAEHSVDGVALHPGGNSSILIDVVVRDSGTGEPWGVLVAFPPESGPILREAQYPNAQIE
jgi:hypothetical protein